MNDLPNPRNHSRQSGRAAGAGGAQTGNRTGAAHVLLDGCSDTKTRPNSKPKPVKKLQSLVPKNFDRRRDAKVLGPDLKN